MAGDDLQLYPLYDTLDEGMRFTPAFPRATTSQNYVSLGQIADFIAAGGQPTDGSQLTGTLGPNLTIPNPTLTGDPKAPTPPPGDNDTSVATTQFVTRAIPVSANPSTVAGDVMIGGSAATFMRSDATPAIQKASASVFGLTKVDGTTITAAGGVISAALGTGITQLTGDVLAGPGSGSQVATLKVSNGNVGTFQGLTVNAKGLVTAAVDQGYITPAVAAATYAPIASPLFTGDPRAPTPATADNDTSIATTAFVKAQNYMIGAATWTVGAVTFATSTTTQGQDPTQLFWDDVNNYLGVGTNVPNYKIDVNGYARVSGTAIIDGSGGALQVNDRVTAGTYSVLYRLSGITRFLDSVVGSDVLTFNSVGNVGIGTATPISKLSVHVGTDQNFSAGLNGGLTTIGGLNDVGNAWVPLQINPNGPVYIATAGTSNVGIGTTTPGARLEVKGAAGVSTPLAVYNNDFVSGTTGSSLSVTFGAASGNTYASLVPLTTGNTAYGNLALCGSGGNVGIGTTNPLSSKLAVRVGTDQNISSGVNGGLATIGALNDAASGWAPLQINPNGPVYVAAAGNSGLGVGTTNPQGKLHVVGTAAAGNYVSVLAGGPNGADSTTYIERHMDAAYTVQIGAIVRNGTNTVAYLTTSDERLKDEIRPTDRGLDALMALKVSDYRMGETAQQGLLAQDVARVYPEAVHPGGDDPQLDPWMLDYGRLTPLLIRTIQQQQAQLERQDALIERLESHLVALEKKWTK